MVRPKKEKEYSYGDYVFLVESIQKYEGCEEEVKICLKGETLNLEDATGLSKRIERAYLESFQKQGLTLDEAEDEFFAHITRAMLCERSNEIVVSRN